MLALVAHLVDPALHLLHVGQQFACLLLCEEVHVVGILHLVEESDNLLRGECHAQTYACRCPCLGKGVEHYHAWKMVKERAHGAQVGEVAVGLVHHHYSLELEEQFLQLAPVHVVARGIVGRAYPHHLGVLVARLQQCFSRHGIISRKTDRSVFYIIDISTNLVHTVCRFYGHNIVHSWFAENTVHQVYGLVASVAQEYPGRMDSLDQREVFLERLLQGIGIAVVGSVIGTLVGIQEHVRIPALELVSGTGIGFQCQYVLSYQIL